MRVELRVPPVGESITEVEVGDWLKKEGDTVQRDENVVILETDKTTVELPVPEGGTIAQIMKPRGSTATIGEVLAVIETDDKLAAPPAPKAASPAPAAAPAPAPAPAKGEKRVMPSAERVLAQNNIAAEQVQGTGPGGRVLKEDAQKAAANNKPPTPAPQAAAALLRPPQPAGNVPASIQAGPTVETARRDEVVPMNKLRRTIAARLVEAQQTAALLTTFNEVDMSAVMALRKEHQEAFMAKYSVKLGFMSFFVKAVIEGLKQFPAINAELQGNNIVYHNYFDIGVAIGGGKGLVVPILRSAERMSFAQIEVAIGEFAKRAKEGALKVEELQGGTFTITNGGVYGSLLSTPIVNPPQSGILGMHSIQERPMAVNGQVVIKPMMYIALTYDHRIVDGREAVSFLRRVKEVIETPARLLLEV
ncbi:MAG TPA: 2-oxoglutarate dehydrogenase complex dihydrolipoyllysine-residue succinyltransferase [Methylomirabilota bacterium]|nr:2-oxoglutarate dehydrogenase complex dihydrolipoyllysine-residue succinyltransferase [Methylomirabilota bacterium]